MIGWTTHGSFKNMENFLDAMTHGDIWGSLGHYGSLGAAALQNATPTLTGMTAASWYFKVEETSGSYSIEWRNDNVVGGTPLVILLQYGHGTGTGGYVQGRDFINPAIEPVFKEIEQQVWKAVMNA